MNIDFSNLGSVNKTLILIVIVASLPVIAIMAYNGFELKQRLVDSARYDATHMTESMADIHNEVANSAKQILSTLALLPAIKNGDLLATNSILKYVLDQNPTYMNFTLTNLAGDVIASAVPFSGVNLGDRKHFREALIQKKFAVGEYIRGRLVTNIPALPFAYPVIDEAGNPTYILTAAIRLNVYQQFFDRLHLPDKSFISVTDNRGIRLLYYPPNEKSPPGNPIKRSNWEVAQSSEQGTEVFLGLGSDGIERILTFVKFHPTETSESYVYLWAGIPTKEIRAPANAIFLRNMSGMLVATVIALAFAIFIGHRTIISPIKSLMKMTNEFSAGNLYFRSQPINQPEEFEKLTEAFDKMATVLVGSQKALYEREESLILILNSASEAIYGLDQDGNCTFCNQSALDILGYRSESEIVGKNMHQLIHHSYADGSPHHVEDCNIYKSFQTGKNFHGDSEVMWREDGSSFDAEYRSHPIVKDGKTIGSVVSFLDVSERKKTERLLERTKDRLESLWNISKLTDESLQGICDHVLKEIVKITDSPYGFYGFLDEDEEVMTIYSWSTEAMKDCAIHNQPIMFPIDKSGIWGNAVRTKKPFLLNDYKKDCEFKTGIPEGHVALTRVLSVPVVSADKVVAVGAVANKAHDYTQGDIEQLRAFMDNVQILIERQNIQDALEEQTEYYSVLFYGSPHPTAVADAESGTLIACNSNFSDLLGYSTEEIIGQHQSKFHHAKPSENKLTDNFVAHKNDSQGKYLEDKLITKDGRFVDVEITASMLNLKGKDVLLGFFKDVTEHKMMLKERHRSAQLAAIGTLAAGVAHEINNPIQGILNYASMIERNASGNERIQKASSRIVQESQRIANITKNLLTYSKDTRLEKNLCKVDQLIKDALSLISTKTKNSGIQLSLDVAPDLPEVYWQVQSIQQVILNLVDNATDALSTKFDYYKLKQIDVKAVLVEKQAEQFIRITVQDNGSGMSQETIDRSYEEFFTTKSSDMGTGLGLSIVKDIVNKHGGSISIESIEGEFTKVNFELPVTQEQVASITDI
ncbi:MAG: hypothetical protein C0614_06715 [Desulfuromonas sp.]|nr:MAG: hypothetical protein C0614_06715 [Desulfuromonas sp.]